MKKTHETMVTNRGLISDGKSAKTNQSSWSPKLQSQLGIHTFSALGIFFGRFLFLALFCFKKKICQVERCLGVGVVGCVNLLRWLPRSA